MYTLKGEIKHIGETTQITDTFKKRDIVISDVTSQYPQTILFQLTQDRVSLADVFMVGEMTEVHFFLKGREWNNPKDGKTSYFNTLECYRLQKLASNTTQQTVTPDTAVTEVMDDDSDGLPF